MQREKVIYYHQRRTRQKMVKQVPYLLGRFMDPLLAIVIGTTSYYLYETRTTRDQPTRRSLLHLLERNYSGSH
ncbi:hypothetical protein NCAS_0D04660 [Naumovozyma castellii]|uniref:Uncharacterized protein n=1 Tax=Naumovozyma castellii TaxID=27288 RepID=G0VEQ6_NAUCA|nr:hypothetical protein NCAS_0D04660 [Naumovozyma castellii CBS 4309]CCC70047.1 hypothetical protein NCAS_0D04660 [Naumovozyma castellii CBS 4309]